MPSEGRIRCELEVKPIANKYQTGMTKLPALIAPICFDVQSDTALVDAFWIRL